MAELSADRSAVNARILYWGIEGAGKTSNLNVLQSKLRPDHRGEIRRVPTPLDPSIHYEVLPISLGEIGGVRTSLQIIAAPGAREQAPTRKQLLDQVDGVVFVIDPQRDRIDANLQAFEELRRALADFGRSIDDVPMVLQYNKRDLSDQEALEELHRKIDLSGAAAFEATASQGSGVLQTLTTISKRVVRALRTPPPAQTPAPEPPPVQTDRFGLEPTLPMVDAEEMKPDDALEELEPIEEAGVEQVAQQATAQFEASWDTASGGFDARTSPPADLSLQIESVGPATRVDARSLRVPLVLRDEDGREAKLCLTLSLDDFETEV